MSSLDDAMLMDDSSTDDSSPGKRGLESQIVVAPTPAKRGKQASQQDKKSFKDRCIEWYKNKKGRQKSRQKRSWNCIARDWTH